MKKVISAKEIVIVLISVLLITVLTSTSVSAIDGLVNQDEYQNAQQAQNVNQKTNNSVNDKGNLNLGNNNNNNNSVLPQTGVADYNVGLLLIICVGSAIFAYKKISDYKNI